jgi:hypothetical protein
MEGGDPNAGNKVCVQGWENFWGGGKLGQVLKELESNDQYVVEVIGWDCKTGKPTGTRKRDDVVLDQEDSLSDGEWINQSVRKESLKPVGDLFKDYTASGRNALLLPVGDLDAGSFVYKNF